MTSVSDLRVCGYCVLLVRLPGGWEASFIVEERRKGPREDGEEADGAEHEQYSAEYECRKTEVRYAANLGNALDRSILGGRSSTLRNGPGVSAGD